MRGYRFAVVLLGGVGVLSCAGETRPHAATLPIAATTTLSFSEWEQGWLEELGATDARLALRMRVKPSPAAVERAAAEAVIRGDEGLGVLGGAIDVFSFSTRERRLGVLRAELARAPVSPPAETTEERLLLGRLLAEEDVRVGDERQLPESASELVRALATTWTPPTSVIEAGKRDEALRARLVALGSSVRLAPARIIELEDALDPLERLAVPEGYPETTKALTFLRVVLGQMPSSGYAPPSLVPALAGELAAHLGVGDDPRLLAARLEGTEANLRREVLTVTTDASRRAAADHVVATTACDAPANLSSVRSMAPSRERDAVCDELHLVASAATAFDRTVAALALHDNIVVALWAIELRKPDADVAAIRLAHRLLSGAAIAEAMPDRLSREALVTPVRAIAAGLAATILDAEGPDQRRARANRWLAFGDAPFDVVAAHLSVRDTLADPRTGPGP